MCCVHDFEFTSLCPSGPFHLYYMQKCVFVFLAGIWRDLRPFLAKKCSGGYLPCPWICRGQAPFRSLCWVRATCSRPSSKVMWFPAAAEIVGCSTKQRNPMDPTSVPEREPAIASAYGSQTKPRPLFFVRKESSVLSRHNRAKSISGEGRGTRTPKPGSPGQPD